MINQDLKQQQLFPAIVVTLCGAAWGVFWYPQRWLDHAGIGSAWVATLFGIVATLAPLPWLLRNRPTQREFATQLLTGLILGGAFTFYMISLATTDVIHSILLFYLNPIWSTLIAYVMFGERLTSSRAFAVMAGIAGVAIILGIDQGLPYPRQSGDWFALVSGFLWAIGTTRSNKLPSSNNILPGFTFGLGGLMVSAVALILAYGLHSPLAQASNLAASLPIVIILALTIYVPPNFLLLWATRQIDSARIGILLMSELVVGVVSAGLYSGEPFGPKEIIGTLLICTAGLVEVFARR